jgi:hypothetical protein
MSYLLMAISLAILLVLGIKAGRNTIKFKSIYINMILILFIVLANWIGINTYIIKLFKFELMLSSTLQVTLLGILISRIYFMQGRTKKVRGEQ